VKLRAKLKARIGELTKPRELSVTPRGKAGMSNRNNTEVIAALRKAKARGEIPSLTFEYNPHTILFGKDPLYLRPKSGDLKRVAVKVRRSLRKAFGSKYTVRLV